LVKEDVTQDGDVERDNEPVLSSETEGNRGAGPTRVLLIEDDPRAAFLIAEMLRTGWPGGLVVAQADSLIDATRELLEHGTGSVLLDLSLPTEDPLAAIEQVRTAAPDAPLVVLVGEADNRRALASLRAGAQDVLVKRDLSPALLHRAMRYAIERKRLEVRLAHMALHDPLTELPNRALFLDRLGVALDRSRRTNTRVGVLFLDVDNFKHINDSYGHEAGDAVLVGLAERLRAMLRPMDTVARFGGDEFTFLFEDLATDREIVLIAERIRRATSRPIRLIDTEASVTVSMGIATVDDPSVTPESVLREADAAMYRAKELGRSRYELYDESSRQRALERLELEAALGHAIERDELLVVYQPKFALNGAPGVAGLEALVRWQHPERGLIAPSEFIPLAEETGVVHAIGEYVLERALAQICRWRAHRPDMTMSVNLSFRQLEDVGLAAMLTNAMNASEVPPGAVCVEIAEDAVTRNPELITRSLGSLKSAGVEIAIDDYGTGATSLPSLKRLPIDSLKIHESFVTGIGSNTDETSIVGAVVELGHALGLRVTAEGVETDAQLAHLRSLGCDAAQGYLLGRPMPEYEIEALLG
jgi:diguanylate cyclase (GGDEF)-like protein